MFERWRGSSDRAAGIRRGVAPLLGVLALLAAGCGSVAVSVEQPVGAQVELCEKGKWFGCCGPDVWTGWDTVGTKAVEAGEPFEMELDAIGNWLERYTTFFPRQYRAFFDLSKIHVYPKTPSSMVEIRHVREVIPPKHQHIIKLWHEGRTLDVLTHLPPDVLGDVLYNLGGLRRRLFQEVKPELLKKAAQEFQTMLDSPTQPSPKEVESWLKSFLTREQLGQICQWVREGVTLKDVKWVSLRGEPKEPGWPIMATVVFGVFDLFIRVPEKRVTEVDFFQDVIIRDLAVKKVEARLVNVGMLKFYAELKTFDTTYYSDRTIPPVDLVQDVGLATVVRPSREQEDELQRYGMTRSVSLDTKARADAIRSGLPPVALKSTQVTSFRSQILGALLDGEMAYLVIWHAPKERDAERYLTTVVTTNPYGMARVWAYCDGRELAAATAAFDTNKPPLGELVAWILRLVDQRELFVKLNKPLAVIAFGRRRLEPWSDEPPKPVSFEKPSQELEPVESGE